MAERLPACALLHTLPAPVTQEISKIDAKGCNVNFYYSKLDKNRHDKSSQSIKIIYLGIPR